MVMQTCNPSSPEVEGEGVQGHSGLHVTFWVTCQGHCEICETLSQTNKQTKKRGHAHLGILQKYITK